MKKTEKIEIRVTPEEKQGLMDLARSEGRSLSELIRGILGTYIEAQTSKASTPKQRINHMLKSPKTWSLATVLSLISGALIIAPAAQAEKSYTVNVEITDQKEGSFLRGSVKRHKMTAYSIQQTDNFIDLLTHETNPDIQTSHKTLSPKTDYEVLIKVQEYGNDTSFAQFKICKKAEAVCKTIAEPSIQFNPDEGGRVKIGSVITDPETGKDVPYDLITIDISQDNS